MRFPFDSEKQAEFVEINTSLPRLLASCVEPDSDYKQYKKSPWRTTPGTLIGSGKVAVRYAAPAGSKPDVVVRLLEPLEYLACIGWDITFCEQQFFNLKTLQKIKPDCTVAEYADLIGDMAGNAWSAYSYAAVRTALIATSGKFMPEQGAVDVSGDAGEDGDQGGSKVKKNDQGGDKGGCSLKDYFLEGNDQGGSATSDSDSESSDSD